MSIPQLTHRSLDLVPSHSFRNRLPAAFATDYIHWYDHERDEVIFRPRGAPWSSCEAEWKLVRKGVDWRLLKGVCALANITSYTASTLSTMFDALEDPEHIHIILDTSTQLVHIRLPRLQLDFYVEQHDDRVQSRQYRGMILDPAQTMGTLVGLTSKLILKPATGFQDRLVLVPVPRTFGSRSVKCGKTLSHHHVSISIDKEDAHVVFAYTLDTTLGRVLESGDVQRRLYLALLHALTSHCLPDSLIGYTGTESALKILQSAAVRSFELLTAENVELLHQIANISPVRSFYPQHLMEMQEIGWNTKLPSLSQHPKLRAFAKEIISQAETMRLYHPDKMPDTKNWKSSNPHLEVRDSIRMSTFRVFSFGADAHTTSKDVFYKARDVLTQSQRGQRAYIAASLIARNEAALATAIPDLNGNLLQKHFKDKEIEGPSDSFDSSILQYDSEWLCDSTKALTKYWCDLHRALPKLMGTCNEYDTATWLSTMAFAETADMRALQAFAAFYRLREMASAEPPSSSVFHLSDGSTWKTQEIKSIIVGSTKYFDDSLEARILKQDSETENQHHHRIHALFQTRRDQAVEIFVADLQRQWPCKVPAPSGSKVLVQYIDVSGAMSLIKARFKTWYRNRQFLGYLLETSKLIARQTVVSIVTPRPSHSKPLILSNLNGQKVAFHIDNIFATAPPVVFRKNAHHSAPGSLVPPSEPQFPMKECHTSSQNGRQTARLEKLCTNLQSLATSEREKEYVKDLGTSCASLEALYVSTSEVPDVWPGSTVQNLLQTFLDSCNNYFKSLNLALVQAVAHNNSVSDQIGLLIQHSPRIPPTFWLAQLHRDRFYALSDSWKMVIIEYGLAVTQLHRAQRLVALSHKPADLMEELGYVGHSNWDPNDFPETLLLEAESGILIRREQEFIASHMRDSQDSMNIVLQLLMGGGKSSTIVPMLAAYLTDKQK